MSKQVKTAYRYRFYPSSELKVYLAQNFGCCRFVYNKLLEYSETNYLTKFIDQTPKNKDPKNINPHYKNITSNDRVKYVKTLKDTVVIIEDLNIAGMLKNRKLSKAIHNVAWSRFLTYLTYKAKWHDKEIIKVNRFYPSSKLCSHCGFYNKGLTLKERAWQCNQCQTHHDRDQNACLNLKNYYTLNLHKLNSKDLRSYLNKLYHNDKFKDLNTTVGTAVSACGGDVRPEKQKKINSSASFETKAVSCEARISVL